MHDCEYPAKDHRFAAYGHAIDHCYEDEDGLLWASNTEYESQINYCPFCGYKAKIQINNV